MSLFVVSMVLLVSANSYYYASVTLSSCILEAQSCRLPGVGGGG